MPLVDTFEPILTPASKVLEWLHKPLPIVSNLVEVAGGIVEALAYWGAEQPDTEVKSSNALNSIATILDVAAELGSISFETDEVFENAYVNLGDFDLSGNGDLRARTAVGFTEFFLSDLKGMTNYTIGQLPGGFNIAGFEEDMSDISGENPQIGNLLSQAFDPLSGGPQFPILQDPRGFVSLLYGPAAGCGNLPLGHAVGQLRRRRHPGAYFPDAAHRSWLPL